MEIDELIDDNNKHLWKSINETHNCRIQFVNDRNEYACFTKNRSVTFYVPELNKNSAPFTHELLHVFLRQKKIFIGASLKRSVSSSTSLRKIYSERLLEHMGNCFDHIKMLPYYLDMNYERKLFLYEYHVNKCSSEELAN